MAASPVKTAGRPASVALLRSALVALVMLLVCSLSGAEIWPRRASSGAEFTVLYTTDFEDDGCPADFAGGTLVAEARTACNLMTSPAPLAGLESMRNWDNGAVSSNLIVHSLHTPVTSGIYVIDFLFVIIVSDTGAFSRMLNMYKDEDFSCVNFTGVTLNEGNMQVFTCLGSSSAPWDASSTCASNTCRGRFVFDFNSPHKVSLYADIDSVAWEDLPLRAEHSDAGAATASISGIKIRFTGGTAPDPEGVHMDNIGWCTANDGLPDTGRCGSF